MSASIINIHDDIKKRTIPVYSDEEVILHFKDELEYLNWYNEVATNHGVWRYHQTKTYKRWVPFVGQPLEKAEAYKGVFFPCDHAHTHTSKITESEAKRRKVESKKVGCTARILKYYMTDNTLTVNYKWQHIEHDPSTIEEIIKGGLTDDMKEWIKKHVEQDMDWKQIKKLLRMDESRLKEASTNSKFTSSESLTLP